MESGREKVSPALPGNYNLSRLLINAILTHVVDKTPQGDISHRKKRDAGRTRPAKIAKEFNRQ